MHTSSSSQAFNSSPITDIEQNEHANHHTLLSELQKNVNIFNFNYSINPHSQNTNSAQSHINATLRNLEHVSQSLKLEKPEAQEFLEDLTKTLELSRSTATQKSLLTIIQNVVHNNLSAVNLNFLSKFAHLITQQDDGVAAFSPELQKQIITLTQSALNFGWQYAHSGQKELSNQECEKYLPTLTAMTKVLEHINQTPEFDLQFDILKLCVGAFKMTTEHIVIPDDSPEGKALSNSIVEFDNSLQKTIQQNKKGWKNASKQVGNSSSDKKLAKAAGITTFLGTSVPALVPGVLGGATGGVLGFGVFVARTLFAPVGMIAAEITSNKSHPSRHYLRKTFVTPFKYTAKGAEKGWNIVAPDNLAYKVYDALYDKEASKPDPKAGKGLADLNALASGSKNRDNAVQIKTYATLPAYTDGESSSQPNLGREKP